MNHVYSLIIQITVIALVGLASFHPKLNAASANWPQTITYPADITVEIISESSETEGSIYHSNHFELISDHPLSLIVICDVLRVLEASYASLQALPLGFEHAASAERHVVKLINSEKNYVERGGVRGSGGVYLSESREALIRVDTLGAELSDEGRITSIENLGLITHEITHQLQHDWLEVLPTWLIEGLAVYLESVPYQDGTLLFKNMDFRAEKHIARCSENRYWITNIERLMTIERDEWNQHFEEQPLLNDQHYVTAFLLTYYFLHMAAPPADTPLRTYIQSMKETNSPHTHRASLTQLMQGRSYQELEHDLITAYAQAGLELQTFVDSTTE